MLKKLIEIIEKRTYCTEKQKEVFEQDLNPDLERKIKKLKKESKEKDRQIENLLVDVLLLENDVNVLS